ncbi:RING finger protein 141-like [Xenia sp. Carnegie-2017]|uniref:RING finger protein 141-like n=1 Tax=Xenia sp. Carnegie-2017 TaxID=2897299 RepID=UPI001F045335|nr:RING finger protein 141-like [Xenia sp. Carnegie-2017]
MGHRYSTVVKTIQDNALVIRDFTSLSYDGLIKAVEELNIILDDLAKSEKNDFQLLFAVSSDDTSYLWKALVKITCCKINKTTNSIETEKCLDLPRFLRIYRELSKRYAKKSQLVQEDNTSETNDDLTISLILSRVDEIQREVVEECCICMERNSDVSLACAHSYCKECIHLWFDEHNTCPICRETVEGRKELWVLADKPSQIEIADYEMGFSDDH